MIIILFILLAFSLVIIPSDVSAQTGSTSPEVVQIGIYVQDFNKFSVADGTIETSFYMTLRSETNVSFDDFEIVNGQVTSVDTISNQTNEKEYRISAELTADPDLRRFPFDRHVIRIEIEPKHQNEEEMVLVIDLADSGIDPDSDLPGWELSGSRSEIVNRTYIPGEIPYSRAVYGFGIERDGTSTILKFFLPIMLIIVVALASLMIKISSRLGLNASMFLAAVLIHWRIVDNIPVVAYATFLDLFMMITYATLVMVLVSGIIILKYTEAKDQDHIALVNAWSIRIIPSISLTLFCVLFISLLVQ